MIGSKDNFIIKITLYFVMLIKIKPRARVLMCQYALLWHVNALILPAVYSYAFYY